MARAKFTVETRAAESPVQKSVRVTKCECGWETTATDSSLYGPPNALSLALLSHRLSHLENSHA
jgi:hypothetical protein